MHNPIQTKGGPEGAAIAGTTRITNFNKTDTPTLSIYTDASSRVNGTHSGHVSLKNISKAES